LFGRHEAPVLTITSLPAGEHIFLLYGLIPNKAGAVVVRRWFGLRYRGDNFVEVLELTRVIEITGIDSVKVVNPSVTEAATLAHLASLLADSAERGKDIMKQARQVFNEMVSPKLMERYELLERRRRRHEQQLEFIFEEMQVRAKALARNRIGREREAKDRDFDEYRGWLGEHMALGDDAFLRFIAVFTGKVK
jgi:hypothetical protein